MSSNVNGEFRVLLLADLLQDVEDLAKFVIVFLVALSKQIVCVQVNLIIVLNIVSTPGTRENPKH